ncbi:hypothetical protein HMPREF9371_1019 [Neisseria shayeganii 871]|uniref:Transposase IS4-like domain-containing protein n=1 Tax=Neisseria shayeganii 871 TaxID=1032488 RepID=G4CHD0_9NEIS|nr:hypothetical protein HMPREF9371_1019 [Neisseria shayeganii 871]
MGQTYHGDRQASEQHTTQKCAADEGFAKVSEWGLKDGVMQKAHRGRPLSQGQKVRNGRLAKVRYVVEQSFGTLHRKFRHARAAYFGLSKVRAQSHLKAMCVNLLKAANRIRVPMAA